MDLFRNNTKKDELEAVGILKRVDINRTKNDGTSKCTYIYVIRTHKLQHAHTHTHTFTKNAQTQRRPPIKKR